CAFDGTTIFSITYNNDLPWPVSAAGYGFSLVQVSPDTYQAPDRAYLWRASSQIGGSPGFDDPPPSVSPVFINEILVSYSDTSGDFIELYNPNQKAVNISGWFITNDKLLRQKYTIPSNTVIPAMGYVDIFNISTYGNFTFSPLGDKIYLFSADADGNLTGYTHGFAFNATEPGISIGRVVNSVGEELFLPQKTSTPGQPNAGAKTGPIIINEIMYHPADNGIEYIELANISSNAVPLFDTQNPINRWKINGAGFVFPENVWLAPGGILLVVATNPTDFRTTFAVDENVQIFGPFTGNLQNDGETLSIYRPFAPDTNGAVYFNVIDEVRYNDKAPWPVAADGTGLSLHRINPNIFGNEPSNWMAATPSPGISLDMDNDGLPDIWEAAFGTDLTMPDDIDDTDGDGISNKNEYLAGSNPLDANSYLSLQAEPSIDNNCIIKFVLYAGRSYSLEYTDSIAKRWNPIAFYELRMTNRIEYFSHCTTNKSGFYRLKTSTQLK
ncbi:MAG TPA: lamin tail domain-containing protein, partial [Verrucomicrobiota bacterium]|nr:lamin tail domain-containing protein [Verrucomicrobiota bacterium]